MSGVFSYNNMKNESVYVVQQGIWDLGWLARKRDLGGREVGNPRRRGRGGDPREGEETQAR